MDALLVTVDFDAIVITRTGAAAEMDGFCTRTFDFCVVLYSGLPRLLGPARGRRLPGLAAGLRRPRALLVLVAGVGVDGEGEGLVARGRGRGRGRGRSSRTSAWSLQSPAAPQCQSHVTTAGGWISL